MAATSPVGALVGAQLTSGARDEIENLGPWFRPENSLQGTLVPLSGREQASAFDPVEDELNRESGQDQPRKAGDHVRAGGLQ